MANIGDLMAAEAHNYLGYPYVWNTHGPNSFDCSGLVHWVVKQVTGQSIPTGTASQQSMGTLVSPIPDALRPGDLLFYEFDLGSGVVGHVAIYVGDGMIIDAANESTGVRKTTAFGSWYGDRFLFARRLFAYDDNEAPGSAIEAGDTITAKVPVFASADVTSAITLVGDDAVMCVTGAVVTVGGVDFLPVEVDEAAGYVIAGTAQLDEKGGCEEPGGGDPGDADERNPSAWQPGDTLEIVDDPLNCRTSYPSGTVIGTYSTGEQVCMVGGPASANGYTWVQVDGRLDGWIAGEFVKRVGIQTCGGSTPPPPTWTHVVTGSNLNLRTAPGGSLIATMPIGTKLRVIGGPTSQGGYTWYNVESDGYGTGWAVNGFDPL